MPDSLCCRFFLLLALSGLCTGCIAITNTPAPDHSCPADIAEFSTEWLVAPVSREGMMFHLADDRVALRRLEACIRPGDEIWTFTTPDERWRAEAGCSGFAVLRDGSVVGVLVTCRS